MMLRIFFVSRLKIRHPNPDCLIFENLAKFGILSFFFSLVFSFSFFFYIDPVSCLKWMEWEISLSPGLFFSWTSVVGLSVCSIDQETLNPLVSFFLLPLPGFSLGIRSDFRVEKFLSCICLGWLVIPPLPLLFHIQKWKMFYTFWAYLSYPRNHIDIHRA